MLLELLKFYFSRRLAAYKALTACAIVGILVTSVTLAYLLHQLRRQENLVEVPFRLLSTQNVVRPSSKNLELELQVFDSGSLALAIERIGENSSVTIDEVSFQMDERKLQPFLRYQANFNATGTYSAVRSFVKQLYSALGNISLDQLRCTRENIESAAVKCDVAVSAYYQRSKDG